MDFDQNDSKFTSSREPEKDRLSGQVMPVLENKKLEHFIQDFIMGPSIDDVKYRFREPKEKGAGYNTFIIARDYFSPILADFLLEFRQSVPGEIQQSMPNEIREWFVDAARDYALLPLRRNECFEKPRVAADCGRLIALLESPRVIADPVSLDIMLQLKKLDSNEPWSFEMWHDYDRSNERYRLKFGFGREQVVAGLVRFVMCDELWESGSHELQRVFFSSVGMALSSLSKKFPLETAEARIQIKIRNERGANEHEPECSSAFYESEIRQLADIAESHPNKDSQDLAKQHLARIEEFNCMQYDHLC
jgi:hypothetical protein